MLLSAVQNAKSGLAAFKLLDEAFGRYFLQENTPEKVIGKPVDKWTTNDAKKYRDYLSNPDLPYIKPSEINEFGYVGSISQIQDLALSESISAANQYGVDSKEFSDAMNQVGDTKSYINSTSLNNDSAAWMLKAVAKELNITPVDALNGYMKHNESTAFKDLIDLFQRIKTQPEPAKEKTKPAVDLLSNFKTQVSSKTVRIGKNDTHGYLETTVKISKENGVISDILRRKIERLANQYNGRLSHETAKKVGIDDSFNYVGIVFGKNSDYQSFLSDLNNSQVIFDSILDDTTQPEKSSLLDKIKQSPSGLSAFKVLETLFTQLEYKDKSIADLIDSGDLNATFRAVLDRYNTEDDYVKKVGLKNILDLMAKKDSSLELIAKPAPYRGGTAYREKIAIDAIEQGKSTISSLIGDNDRAMLKKRAQDIRKLPEFNEFVRQKIRELQEEKSAEYAKFKEADNQADISFYESNMAAISDKIMALSAQYNADKNDPFKVAQAIGGLKLAAYKKGKKAIDAILEKSPISQAQADNWAKKQVISKETFASIAKKGYPKEQLLADMAEFYRLTHGKIKDVSIGHSRQQRAHSSGKLTNDLLDGYIELGSSPSKRVLFHELAHNLESDVLAKELANGFLIKRRESPETYSLNRLHKGGGYDSSERAYKDDFIHPYIGKVYSNDVTEVFSMGVETLADPSKFAELIALDEEHAALILQYLTHDSEILNATRKLAGSVVEGKKQEALSAEKELKAIIDQLAPKAKLTIENIAFSQFDRYLSVYAGRDFKYIGSISDTEHIIEGKIKENYQGRAKKGFAVVRIKESSAGFNAFILRPRKELDAVIALSQAIGDSMDVANKLLSVESIKQLKKELQDVN